MRTNALCHRPGNTHNHSPVFFGKACRHRTLISVTFAALLKQQTRDSDITAAADGVIAALNQAVIAEKHGAGKPEQHRCLGLFPQLATLRQSADRPAIV